MILWDNHKENFWSLVDKRSENECWLWKGGTNDSGYGLYTLRYTHHTETHSCHKISYFIQHNIESKNTLRHSCDIKLCVNPRHLTDGSKSENDKEAFARRLKTVKGIKNPRSNLTEEDVRQIRKLAKEGKVYRQISNIFNLPISSVGKIVNRQYYADVD